jgi:hypothetical protein
MAGGPSSANQVVGQDSARRPAQGKERTRADARFLRLSVTAATAAALPLLHQLCQTSNWFQTADATVREDDAAAWTSLCCMVSPPPSPFHGWAPAPLHNRNRQCLLLQCSDIRVSAVEYVAFLEGCTATVATHHLLTLARIRDSRDTYMLADLHTGHLTSCSPYHTLRT